MINEDTKFEPLTENWALALMDRGVIVKISFKTFRTNITLNFEDLGIKHINNSSKDYMNKYIKLGKEKIFPPEVINKIQTVTLKARKNLNEHSYDTVWGRFVPYKAFNDWEKYNNIIKEEFYDLSEYIFKNYERIIEITKNDYKIIGEDVWKRLSPGEETPSSFIESFCNRILKKMPEKEDILTKMDYNVTYFTIPVPSIIQENITIAKKELEMQNNIAYESELEKQTKKRVHELYLHNKNKIINEFLNATTTELRETVFKICESILKSISYDEEVKDVNRMHREKIKKLVEKVEKLNFYNDIEIESMLKKLRYEACKFKEQRNKFQVKNILEDIVEKCKEELTQESFNSLAGYIKVD